MNTRVVAKPLPAWALFVFLATGCASSVGQKSPTLAPAAAQLDTTPICYNCFWQYQPSEARQGQLRAYAAIKSEDPLVRAEVALVAARIGQDQGAVCRAATDFKALAAAERAGRRRLLALETVAFLADECGLPTSAAFKRAASAANAAGERWKATVYRAIAAGRFQPTFGESRIDRSLRVPAGADGYILGASSIRVGPADVVVTQLERVGRDWLLAKMTYGFPDGASATPPAALLKTHEGAAVNAVVKAAPVRLLPASGVLVVHAPDGRWLAADGAGVFRFEVLPDKIQYPTTRGRRGVALLVDTHGVSALVEPALRLGASLVIACGDHPAKMQAAFDLARHGVNVYFPTDRFVSEVIGYSAPGVLIGSAPVRREGEVAVIGDRPIRFRFDELVVAQTTAMRGDFQYYDAPGRFFDRLAELLPIRVEHVAVEAQGRTSEVVARARVLGADVIAVRVWNDPDHDAVAAWLRESPRHRAVVFHSMAYEAGAWLMDQVPRQATFGDPNVRFTVPGS